MLRKQLLNKRAAESQKDHPQTNLPGGNGTLQQKAQEKAENLSRQMEETKREENIKQGLQTAEANKKSNEFQRRFKKGADFVYGMRRPRAEYITSALGSEASVIGGSPTVDGQNRYIVPTNLADATIDLSLPGMSIKAYHDFLAQHDNVKYQALAEYRGRFASSPTATSSEREREKYIIYSCKAKIDETALKGNMIHFVLDKGNHDWDMEAVVRKEGKAGNIITAKELRHIYKNWSTLSQNVIFWRDGQEVKAPWEENKELWDTFKQKKERDGENNRRIFETFKELYNAFKTAKSAYEADSDPLKMDALLQCHQKLKDYCVDKIANIDKSSVMYMKMTKLMEHANKVIMPHIENVSPDEAHTVRTFGQK